VHYVLVVGHRLRAAHPVSQASPASGKI